MRYSTYQLRFRLFLLPDLMKVCVASLNPFTVPLMLFEPGVLLNVTSFLITYPELTATYGCFLFLVIIRTRTLLDIFQQIWMLHHFRSRARLFITFHLPQLLLLGVGLSLLTRLNSSTSSFVAPCYQVEVRFTLNDLWTPSILVVNLRST